MGLDIYLKKFENFNETIALEEKHEKESDEIWNLVDKKYEEMSEKEKEDCREKCDELKEKLGLDEYGEDIKRKKTIEINSKKYPNHYFKIGYFRSSYNSNGINNVLGNFIGIDLYDIFQKTGNDYYFKPDWNNVKTNVKSYILKLKEIIKTENNYKCVFISMNRFCNKDEIKINNEKDALRKFLEIKNNTNNMGNSIKSFSNLDGEFYLDKPLEVSGVICGVIYGIKLGVHGEYIIYKNDLTWYVQALEIIEETCNWILKKKDKEKYYLAFSG